MSSSRYERLKQDAATAVVVEPLEALYHEAQRRADADGVEHAARGLLHLSIALAVDGVRALLERASLLRALPGLREGGLRVKDLHMLERLSTYQEEHRARIHAQLDALRRALRDHLMALSEVEARAADASRRARRCEARARGWLEGLEGSRGELQDIARVAHESLTLLDLLETTRRLGLLEDDAALPVREQARVMEVLDAMDAAHERARHTRLLGAARGDIDHCLEAGGRLLSHTGRLALRLF